MKRSERRQQIIGLVKRCWIILVLVGLAYYLWHNGHHLRATLRNIPLVNLVSALACIFVGKFAALYLMRASLQLQGSRLTGWRDNIWVYASSDAAKYMPGGIWAIVGRIVHYRNYGMTATTISKALFLENVGFAITALLLGLPVGFVFFVEQGWLVPLSATIACVLATLGLLIAIRLTRHLDFLGSCDKAVRITLLALVIMLLGWVAMGTSFFLLFPEHNNIQHWLWSIGSYATAFIAGMAVVFAPAGAGVREGMLALTGQLSGMSATMMLDAAILNRAIWVVADICAFTFALLTRLSKK